MTRFRGTPLKILIATAVALATLTTVATPHSAVAQRSDTNPVVVLETNMGNIHIELYPERAPKSVARFLQLVEEGFYDEMLFHRVVRNYVIQTGLLDMQGESRGDDLEELENEADNRLINQRGTVSMARLDDPQSAKAEFFINVRDNHDLNFKSYRKDDYGFAVFGEVIEGMDVVDEVSKLETRRAGILRDFPRQPAAIYQAYILRR